jgi:choline/glycine/proline betaine transport protein
VKILSEVNLWLTLILLAAFMIIGPFDYMAGLLVQEIGGYLDNLLVMTFYVGANEPGNWQSTWTVFFWGWWLAWSPFVGLFIARISRGRTLREFVFGVLLLPTLVTFVWIAVMGGAALHSELFSGGGIVDAVNKDIAYALFATIEHLGAPESLKFVMGLVATLLIGIYFITSADSGALVVNIILSGGKLEPPKASRAGWAIANGVLTAVLLVAGGIAVLQDAVILAALPFSLVIVAMTAGLLKALHHEPLVAPREGRAAEPWTGADQA